MNRRTVIVTDGEQRAALAVVRSLGRAGYRCVVASSSRASIAGGSRFVARCVMVPDALVKPSEFADALVALALEEQAALVLEDGDFLGEPEAGSFHGRHHAGSPPRFSRAELSRRSVLLWGDTG